MDTKFYYQLVCRFLWPFFFLFHPIRALGRENIPEGAAVVCANHTALSDPFFVVFAFRLRHQLQPMAKAELMRVPVLGLLLRKCGVISVSRGSADLKAAKAALSCLKGGKKLLIFPEGTRVHEGESVDAKAGAALFSTRSDCCPIVPVYVPGKKRWFRSTTVVIGEPVYPKIAGRKATAEELDEITREVMGRIRTMREGQA